jgi:hypothetical protein
LVTAPTAKVRQTKPTVARPCRPTLRGLTTGTVMVDTTSSDLKPVILWGDEFSSWLWVLDELKLRPIAVILSCVNSVDLVRGCIGEDCFVGLATDMDKNVLLSLRGLSKLGLVDGRVTSQIGAFASTLALECITGTTSLRRPISGWCHDTWAFSHCEVGGVTTRSTQGCCLIPGTQPLPFAVPRDASTVLCPMATSLKYRPAPVSRVMFPLGCKNLGTTAHPHYHRGGLLPGNLDRRTEVLSPGVFAPKRHWALRNLTLEEVLLAKDFGKVLANLLSSGTMTNLFLKSLTPGKTLVVLVGRWGCNGGVHSGRKLEPVVCWTSLRVHLKDPSLKMKLSVA